MTRQVPATLPGDLIFCHSPSLLGQAISWATRGLHEPATYANHVAGIVSPGVVVEALWTVVEHPLSEMDGEDFQIWRHTGLSSVDRANVAQAARSYLGRSYGGAKILTHLGDSILSKVFGGSPYFFRRMNHRQDYPICSWVWAYAYLNGAGYIFGVEPDAANPDDMHDWCIKNIDWEQVY